MTASEKTSLTAAPEEAAPEKTAPEEAAPEELAVFDDQGRQIGIKSRADVHRDGDWHQLVFVWCAWIDDDGSGRMLLQQRARPGDPYASNLDAPAGGHVIASESHLEAAKREFAEEVGIRLTEEELVYLGQSRLDNPTGGCRRVIQHFYLARRAVDLTELRFNEEVNGFVVVELEGFSEVVEGRRASLQARARFQSAPEEVVAFAVSGNAFTYPERIMDLIRKSVAAIRTALFERRIDLGVWTD